MILAWKCWACETIYQTPKEALACVTSHDDWRGNGGSSSSDRLTVLSTHTPLSPEEKGQLAVLGIDYQP